MFYRLKSDYVLRGWQGVPWMLIKRPTNQAHRLTQGEFQILLLCDGETELTEDLIGSAEQEKLTIWEEKGIIECTKQPKPVQKDQYYKYYENRFVESVFWSVTGRCNFRCRHCYVDGPDGKLGELSTSQAFDLIDQMSACGVLRVDLTGGEPFVRKDFWQLVDRILAHKMTVGHVYSNGWLINEQLLDEFEKRGLKPDVQISFDGVGWHDWMRGIPGAEQAALRALKLCNERGFRTNVSMCIHRGSLASLPQSIEALKVVGVERVKVSNIDMTELWRRNSENYEMMPQEYTEAMLPYIAWYYKAGRPIDELTFGGIISMRRDEPYRIGLTIHDGTENCLDCYMCAITRWNCYITPEGRLLPCMPMADSPQQEKFPLVQDIGLKQGLSDSYYM